MTATLEISEAPLAYSGPLTHLADELKRLDLLIRNGLAARRGYRTPSVLDPFVGLVVSEEEVGALLSPTETGDHVVTDAAAQNQIEVIGAQIKARLKASAEKKVFLPLPHLTRLFQLTTFEVWVILVTLAPELDRKYEKVYAYLQDDVTRKKPTIDLIMRLASCDSEQRASARLAFAPGAPLIKHQLLTVSDANDPLLSRALKLDDRIVNFLLGLGAVDSRLDGVARVTSADKGRHSLPVDETVRARLSSFARASLFKEEAQKLLFYLRGPSGSGRRATVRSVCADLGIPLIEADLERLLDGKASFEEIARLLCREAVLRPAALCLENVDRVLFDEKNRAFVKPFLDAVRLYARLTFLLGIQCWRPLPEQRGFSFIDHEFVVPRSNVRKTLWKSAIVDRRCTISEADLGLLASNFQFTPAQIRDAVEAAENRAAWRTGGEAVEIDMSDLQMASRNQSTAKLTSLAQKVEPRYEWREIVLPDDQLTQLGEVWVQARHRDVVYGDWGFEQKLSLGRGLNVLFSGPAGTGKTMAAEVIARELGLDLYKIDLSQVVSKYIGETEKNLH